MLIIRSVNISLSENAKVVERFLSDNNNIIFGIYIDQQTSIFYQYFIKKILSKKGISLKKVDYINDINEGLINLFQGNNNLYISFKKLKYTGKEKLINFLPYKDVKKYKNTQLINAYEVGKDIKFLMINDGLENEHELFEYLKLNPHMVESEIEKSLINKKNAFFDNHNMSKDDIQSIRMEIFKSKKSSFDLRKILGLIKKEVILKKFNFLIY